jgi:hypothetical protein
MEFSCEVEGVPDALLATPLVAPPKTGIRACGDLPPLEGDGCVPAMKRYCVQLVHCGGPITRVGSVGGYGVSSGGI